jgi:hypothetical protein
MEANNHVGSSTTGDSTGQLSTFLPSPSPVGSAPSSLSTFVQAAPSLLSCAVVSSGCICHFLLIQTSPDLHEGDSPGLGSSEKVLEVGLPDRSAKPVLYPLRGIFFMP